MYVAIGNLKFPMAGVAIVSVATPSERAHAPNQRRFVERRAKITLKYGKCVGLGAALKAKLVAVSKK